MSARKPSRLKAFTLVELMISMSIGTIVMLGVFSTYNYLGRNLTRLSFRSMQESQSRRIIQQLTSDLRNTLTVSSTTAATTTALTLIIQNNDSSLGPVPSYEVEYAYDSVAQTLTRTPLANPTRKTVNGSLDNPATADASELRPVRLPTFSFLYYNGTGQTLTAPAGISIKQVAVNFSLRPEGDATLQRQQGIYTSAQTSSGRIVLLNRQTPGGS